jgi:hypothetical protein
MLRITQRVIGGRHLGIGLLEQRGDLLDARQFLHPVLDHLPRLLALAY